MGEEGPGEGWSGLGDVVGEDEGDSDGKTDGVEDGELGDEADGCGCGQTCTVVQFVASHVNIPPMSNG